MRRLRAALLGHFLPEAVFGLSSVRMALVGSPMRCCGSRRSAKSGTVAVAGVRFPDRDVQLVPARRFMPERRLHKGPEDFA